MAFSLDSRVCLNAAGNVTAHASSRVRTACNATSATVDESGKEKERKKKKKKNPVNIFLVAERETSTGVVKGGKSRRNKCGFTPMHTGGNEQMNS